LLYYLKSRRDKMSTNVAHGGAENKTFYIVESERCPISRVIAGRRTADVLPYLEPRRTELVP
jgi:hypothetical protein